MSPTTAAVAARPIAAALLPIASLIAALIALGGCSQGLYQRESVPPAGAQAKECLGRCDLIKTQCRQRQEARETECGAIYAVAKSEYDLCVQGGAGRCRAPYTCLGADMGICDREYDDCFTLCGGRIERRIQPFAPSRPGAPASAESGGAPAAGVGEQAARGQDFGSAP